MPHVSKPDMKSGWQVVKVLKMAKHPTGKGYGSPLRVLISRMVSPA